MNSDGGSSKRMVIYDPQQKQHKVVRLEVQLRSRRIIMVEKLTISINILKTLLKPIHGQTQIWTICRRSFK